jgi:hypothetical protein
LRFGQKKMPLQCAKQAPERLEFGVQSRRGRTESFAREPAPSLVNPQRAVAHAELRCGAEKADIR